MTKSRRTAPTVSTFPDHDVIVPANGLRKAMTVTGGGSGPDLDAIARAEAALAELSTEFAGWMRAECDRLDAARAAVKILGLSGVARDELFRAAHDIKGEAATFGYPHAAEAAEGLCRLIEHAPDPARAPLALIDQHVDGIRAMICEDVRELAATLAARLRQLADEFLRGENRAGRPDCRAVRA